MKLAIFTSQEFVWENNSFSPLETAIWFHEKFKVKRNVGEHFPFFMNLILADVAALFSLSGERVHHGVGLGKQQRSVEDERGCGESRWCHQCPSRASLGKGWGRGGTTL